MVPDHSPSRSPKNKAAHPYRVDCLQICGRFTPSAFLSLLVPSLLFTSCPPPVSVCVCGSSHPFVTSLVSSPFHSFPSIPFPAPTLTLLMFSCASVFFRPYLRSSFSFFPFPIKLSNRTTIAGSNLQTHPSNPISSSICSSLLFFPARKLSGRGSSRCKTGNCNLVTGLSGPQARVSGVDQQLCLRQKRRDDGFLRKVPACRVHTKPKSLLTKIFQWMMPLILFITSI